MIGPTCHSNVHGQGNVDHGVMLVGIAPGKYELATGKVFTGPSGHLLNNLLEAASWSRDKCYVTNLVCTPNEAPTLEEIMECRPRYLAELEQVKPKLVVLLGTKVTEFFFPKRKPGTLRGTFIPYNNYVIMPAYHPAAILHAKNDPKAEGGYNNLVIDILNDFKKIPRFLEDTSDGITVEQLREVQYRVLTSIDSAQGVLNQLSRDTPISIDVETSNVDEDEKDAFDDNLLCFAVSNGFHTWVFPTQYAAQLTWPTDVQWTFHNSIFDTQQILESANVFLGIHHDSMLLHYCLDERSGKHKLKPITRQHCYADFYEEGINRKNLTNDLEQNLSTLDKVHRYCAHDAAYTQRVTTKFIPRVKAEGMWDVYTKLLLPAANIFKHIQRRGINIDLPYLKELAKEWLPIYQEKATLLKQEIVRLGGSLDLDTDSPKQLSHFLYTVLGLPGGPSTAKDVLELLKDEHPFVEQIIEERHLAHLLRTYIWGVADDIKRDGRVHPSAMLHGTVGGRLTYARPTVNTIPRPFEEQSQYGSKLRKLFIPTPGYMLVEIDQKQAEIWMAYINCNDQQMYQDLLSGDYHSSSAAYIHATELDLVTKSQRSNAKRTTFGKFFGIGLQKLAKQTNKPVAEAREWNRRWDLRYPGYVKWTQTVFDEAVNTGEVVTFTGRKRRFPLVLDTSIRNQAVNYKIQSPSHDILLETEIECYWPMREQFDAHILLDVHDATIFEAPIEGDKYKYAIDYYVKELTRSHFGLHPIPAEIKVGKSWGDSHEYEIS